MVDLEAKNVVHLHNDHKYLILHADLVQCGKERVYQHFEEKWIVRRIAKRTFYFQNLYKHSKNCWFLNRKLSRHRIELTESKLTESSSINRTIVTSTRQVNRCK